jgi:hypothetical protein
MEYFTDERLSPLAWDIVTTNKDYFLNMYNPEDLSGYPSERTKLGYCVGELFDFIREKYGLDNEKAFAFLTGLKTKLSKKDQAKVMRKVAERQVRIVR